MTPSSEIPGPVDYGFSPLKLGLDSLYIIETWDPDPKLCSELLAFGICENVTTLVTMWVRGECEEGRVPSREAISERISWAVGEISSKISIKHMGQVILAPVTVRGAEA